MAILHGKIIFFVILWIVCCQLGFEGVYGAYSIWQITKWREKYISIQTLLIESYIRCTYCLVNKRAPWNTLCSWFSNDTTNISGIKLRILHWIMDPMEISFGIVDELSSPIFQLKLKFKSQNQNCHFFNLFSLLSLLLLKMKSKVGQLSSY